MLDAAGPKQVMACECKDKSALASCTAAGDVAVPFPRCPWALDLSTKPFPGQAKAQGQWGGKDPPHNLGGWFWESGFDANPIDDVERVRDPNLRAMFGAWDALENVDHLYPNSRLGWAAFIAGKRESRRLLGDVVLTVGHFRDGTSFPDAVFPCSWHIDLHAPDAKFKEGLKGQEFISRATDGAGYSRRGPYWPPCA